MSKTNLQEKPVIVGTPIEIENAVEHIRQKLTNLTWVSHPYFIAQRFIKREKQRTFFYPETYAPTKAGSRNYHRLTPDGDYSGMFFFYVGPGANDYNAAQHNIITHPVAIIFSVNLERIDEAKLDAGLFTQELIHDARRILTNEMMNFSFFDYDIISETRDLRECYREFSLDDIEQYNRAPMQCFRFDLLVRVDETCLLPPPPTPDLGLYEALYQDTYE